MRWSGSLFAVIALTLACSDDSGNSAPPGRGSSACNEWQTAYCNLVTACMGPALACDQVKGVSCKSDAEARRCATALGSTTCAIGPPDGCSIFAIADPAPAQKACTDMQAAICQRNEECQPGSRDACLTQINGVLNCSMAIAVMLAFEQCLAETPKISCTNPATPAVCKGVIVLSQ